MVRQELKNNIPVRMTDSVRVDPEMPVSNPYWLNKKGSLGMYAVEDPLLIGKPENDPSFIATVSLSISGQMVSYDVPVVYKTTSRVKGERRRRVELIPAVIVSLEEQAMIFPDGRKRMVTVKVIAGKSNTKANVTLALPAGWEISPAQQSVTIERKDGEAQIAFEVTPPEVESDVIATAIAAIDGKKYTQGRKIIDYDHIATQTLFPRAESRFVRLDIKKAGAVIGYLPGAGDAIPESLEAIGYTVLKMDLEDITSANMKTLDAFIVGVRGVNTHAGLRNYKSTILDFVNNGGNVIYQYNTTRRINWEDFSPYRIDFTGNSSDSRVSVEEAEITMLQPDHPVLNTPNKISEKDFDGWVQERGLYFPNACDSEFQAILSSHDPGETPKDGGLLVSQYGKGYFVYTGYSWFRELPAGVPGAYRLFTNIISLGKEGPAEALNTENE
jgi:hypothetical protein